MGTSLPLTISLRSLEAITDVYFKSFPEAPAGGAVDVVLNSH